MAKVLANRFVTLRIAAGGAWQITQLNAELHDDTDALIRYLSEGKQLLQARDLTAEELGDGTEGTLQGFLDQMDTDVKAIEKI